MPAERFGYTGPAPTVLRNGRHVAPGSPIDLEELEPASKAVAADEATGVEAQPEVTAERDFFDEQGWLEPIDEEESLTGQALKARAAELGVEGRTAMNADDLRKAVEDAEAEAAKAAERGDNAAA